MNPAKVSGNILICCLEEISAASGGCRLNFGFPEHIRDKIGELSGFLGITYDQTVILSAMAELSLQKTVTLDLLAGHFGCKMLKIISVMDEIEALENKNYLRRSVIKAGVHKSYSDFGYTVPLYVTEALRKGELPSSSPAQTHDLPSFLKNAWVLLDERSEGNLTTEELLLEIEHQTARNRDLPFVSVIDDTLNDPVSKCTAFAMCYWRLRDRAHIGIESLADSLFDDFGPHLRFEEDISTGRHELIKENILRVSSGELESEKTISLTQHTATLLSRDFPLLLSSESSGNGVISCTGITPRTLFFSGRVEAQMREAERMLKPKTFRSYCSLLKKNGFRTGITCIFFGEPGTGKTEAVYQLARKTGRNIVRVDLSQTKSKWFGETEKLVRQIFTDYKMIREKSAKEPILFINEADGLFSKRIDNGTDASSTDHTVNTVQNILLQELENFEGILIATTNMAGSLDKAFERRFSFRIRFSMPDARCCRRIWKSKLPELSPKQAAALAERFELTGGEIDVHVRKVLLKRALDKNARLSDILEESCTDDTDLTVRRTVPGFRHQDMKIL